MPQAFFSPDNTVLINFTYIHRQDLVDWFVRGRGKWTLSVSRECERSMEAVPELEAMREWSSIFGKPLIPEQAGHIDALTIATTMRKPYESSSKHMGEAETIAIATRRFESSVFLTDDHEAIRVSQKYGMSVVSSATLLAYAEALGRADHEQICDYFDILRTYDRKLGPIRSGLSHNDLVTQLRQVFR